MSNSKKKPRLGDKLISNTVYLVLDWFVVSLILFIFWIILGKTLSPLDLGLVSTSINLIIFISTFSALGTSTALRKLIPEFKEKKGLKSVYPLVKLCFKPILISLIIISLILLLFSNQIILFIFHDINSSLKYAFLICIFSIMIISIYNVLGSALYGLQNMRRFFLTNFVQVLLRVLFAGLLIFLGFSFLGPLIGFLLAYFFVLFLRFNPDYLTSGKSVSYRKLFLYATPALISSIAAALMVRGEYIILTALKTPEITGIFTIAFTIASVIGLLVHAPSYGLFPIISALSIDKKTRKKQGYLIGLVLRYGLFLISPLSLLLIVFSNHAVLLFSTEEFLASTQYFPILIPGAILYGIGCIFTFNLYNIGKPKIYRNIWVLSSLLFLILSLILTTYFSALGLSFSYFITMLFMSLAGFIYINKFVKLNLFTGDLSKIFFTSLAILSILFVIRPFIDNIFLLGIILPPISLVYLGILLFTNFYRVEDVRILRYFGEKVPVVGKYILTIANFVESRL